MTALVTAFGRGFHAHHVSPPIFDDALVWDLLTAEERSYLAEGWAQALSFFDPELAATGLDETAAVAAALRLQSA